jgi:hypothetical protein
VGAQVDVVDEAVDFLVCQKAFVQALVQERVVQINYFVNCVNFDEFILKFIKVRFQDFNLHVIQVILTKLQHLVSCTIRLCEHALNIALLRRLMNTPCFFQTGLNVLLEEKVAEDQLIFIDGLFADD